MAQVVRYRFPRSVVLFQDEIPASYFMRLVWENGFRSMEEVRRITRFSIRWDRADRNGEVTLPPFFADRQRELPRKYFVRDGAVIKYGADRVKRSHLHLAGVRFCPLCLKHAANTPLESTLPYIRGPWQWRLISNCTKHGCRLISIDEQFRRMESIEHLASSHRASWVPLQPSEGIDKYLTDRLEAHPRTSSFLDQLPVYVVAELCSILGHLKESADRGSLVEVLDSGFFDLSARDAGFAIAAGGSEAIEAFLSARVTAAGHKTAPTDRIYSSFIAWHFANFGNPDYRMVFDLVRNHARAHLPLRLSRSFMS
jgi:hypothetical protein